MSRLQTPLRHHVLWRTPTMMRSISPWCMLPVLALAALAAPSIPAGEKPAGKTIYVEDLVYGRVHGAGLLADVAYPESKEPLPVILSVHGGRWKGGHKRDASSINVKQWAG